MFEKEAKNYAKDCEKEFHTSYGACLHSFQDGAEFGYNKAKGELEEKYKENICNLEMNLSSVTERLEELNKANEWHYMKDGIMPEENQWVLVYDGSYTVCNYHFNAYHKWLDNYENEVYEGSIIAWKEIISPKEK